MQFAANGTTAAPPALLAQMTVRVTNVLANQSQRLFLTMPSPAAAASSFELNWQNAVLSVFLFVMICLTVGGNIFVLLAMCADKHLRSPTHMLMGSLAVADLLLGTTVLPFSAVKLLMNESWPFGEMFCDVWLATDVLCCTASIYLVLVISIDRYIGVKRPLAYPLIVTKQRIYLVIALVWILSLIVSLAPQIGLKSPRANTNECEVNQNLAYALSSALVSFYIPLLVILIIYYRIFKEARNQMRFMQTGTKTSKTGTSKADEAVVTLRVHIGPSKKPQPLQPTAAGLVCQRCAAKAGVAVVSAPTRHRDVRRKENSSYAGGGCDDERRSGSPPGQQPQRCQMKPPSVRLQSASSSTVVSNVTPTTPDMNSSSNRSAPPRPRKFSSSLVLKDDSVGLHRPAICPRCSHRMSTRSLQLNLSRSSSSISRSQQQHHNGGGNLASPGAAVINSPFTSKLAKFKREQKAAKTLAIVVGCFVLCWAPFFIILPIESLCLSCNIPPILFKIFFWLGYYNSTMNPVIYAFSSREFRKAYKRILQCNFNKYRPNAGNTNRAANFNYAISYSNQLCKNRKITAT